MKNTRFKTMMMVVLLSLMTTSYHAFAQPTDTDNPPTDDGGAPDFPSPTDNPPTDDGGAPDFPSAPVDMYVYPALLAALIGGGCLLLKKSNNSNPS